MNLDISKWKPFKIGRLFDVEYGVNLELDSLTESSNTNSINFVSRCFSNNGVSAKVEPIDNILPQAAGLISVATGGSVLSTYVQESPFYSGRDLYVLKPKTDLSKETKLFITTIIEKNKYRYSFGRQANKTLPYIELLLPAKYNDDKVIIDQLHYFSDEGYIPDWEFMEDFIKSLNYKPLTTKNKDINLLLSINHWKDFFVMKEHNKPGLFNIKTCKCSCAGDLEEGNDINYIGAKKSDNGVMKKVKLDHSLISKGNGILFICDGEGSVGYTNYMKDDFIGSTTTSIGYNDDLNEINALFIVTVLDKERFKYSFGRKYRKHLSEIQIKLPILHNEDGSIYIDETHKYSEEGYVPDWRFMEQYIKQLPYGDRL